MKIPTTLTYLLDFKSVKKVMSHLRSKTDSDATKRQYLYSIKYFCDFMGKNPDELIEERKIHRISKDFDLRISHEEKLKECFDVLDEKRSRSHSRNMVIGVKCLYSANMLKLEVPTPRKIVTNTDKVPSLQDLKLMVDDSESPVMRTLLIFSAQSGQRNGVIRSMRYGMVRRGLEAGECPLKIDVAPELRDAKGVKINKNRVSYFFLIGHDAIDALKSYLDFRRSRGEQIDDTSFLFVTEKKWKGEYRPLDAGAIDILVRRAAINSGFIEEIKNTTTSTRYPFRHHCLRKFYQTAHEQAGTTKAWFDFLMGHSLDDVTKAYSHPTEENLKEAYLDAEKKFSISQINMPEQDRMKQELAYSMMENLLKSMKIDPQGILVRAQDELGHKLTLFEKNNILMEVITEQRTEKKVEYEYQTVSNGEVAELLNTGWEYKQNFGDGTVLIMRQKKE